MAILKIKKIIEDLENNMSQVLGTVTKVATTVGYVGTAAFATTAAYSGTASNSNIKEKSLHFRQH